MTLSASPYLAAPAAPAAVSPAWVLAFADRWHHALLTFTAAVYLLAFNGQWRIQADSALYLSLGRNMAEGKGFTYQGRPEHLAYPGWPAVIAATFKVTRTTSLVPIHVVMLLIAAATLAAVYRLVRLHRDRPTAVVVTVGVALTKTFFCYGFELWSDMPFTLGVMCFLAGYEGVFPITRRRAKAHAPGWRLQPPPVAAEASTPVKESRWYDYALLIAGLVIATTTRPTGWPLVVAGAVGLTVDAFRRRASWGVVGLLLVPAAVGVCFAVGHYGQVYRSYAAAVLSNDHHLLWTTVTTNVGHLFTLAASDVLFQVRFGDVFNPVLSAVTLTLGFALFRYRATWGVFFCLLLGIILISQEALDRYFLPVLPLLVLSWWDAVRAIDRKVPRPVGSYLFLGLLAFGSLVNLSKVGGIIVQQRTIPFLANFDQGRFDGIYPFAAGVTSHTGDHAVILARAPYGRVTAYLSRRDVTDVMHTPPESVAGRHVFVVEPADPAIHQWLDAAGLVEGPPVVQTTVGAGHGPHAVSLSLCPTRVR